MRKSWLLFLLCGLCLVGACQRAAPIIPAEVEILPESPVREIALIGAASKIRAEISGMAWCGEDLILLPQYPNRFGNGDEAFVFKIPKTKIDDYLFSQSAKPIEPIWVGFESGDLEQSIKGFEGFEAIVFDGDQFFVSIEARQRGSMQGYLVQGSVEGDCEAFILEPKSIISVQPQADLGNMSDETLIVYGEQLYSVYEANGANVNPEPVAHVFDLYLEPLMEITMPNVEYRLTDATEPDAEGGFWAINYFFPGDTKLKPALDQIAVDFGLGESHQNQNQVERLLPFQITEDGVRLADRPPIYLELAGEISRNWEGIVRYGDGFLLVTDLFPRTILAFVENGNVEE